MLQFKNKFKVKLIFIIFVQYARSGYNKPPPQYQIKTAVLILKKLLLNIKIFLYDNIFSTLYNYLLI